MINSKRVLLAVLAVSAYLFAQIKPATMHGYVIDSACAFTKSLDKPISRDCAVACAKAGSPLVILADDRTIYWPISDKTPASGQNEKLLPYAGQRVIVTGAVYDRGGSKALVIQSIGPEASKR